MTWSHSPTYTVTSPHTSHPFTQYEATHPVTCPHRLSHPVTAGDSHTKKLLRQSNDPTHSHSHGCTLSRTAPMHGGPETHSSPGRHTATCGHAQPPRRPSPHPPGHQLARPGFNFPAPRRTNWPFTNWPSLPGGAWDSELAIDSRGLTPPGNGERESVQVPPGTTLPAPPPAFSEITARSRVPTALPGASSQWKLASPASQLGGVRPPLPTPRPARDV